MSESLPSGVDGYKKAKTTGSPGDAAPIILTPAELTPYQRYRIDLWELIKDGHILTQVEDADTEFGQKPVMKLPANAYYWHLIRWLQGKHPRWPKFRQQFGADPLGYRHIGVKKSRRMQVTWLTSTIGIHAVSFGNNRAWGVGSKVEDDADWLIRERYKFIFDHIPEDCWDGDKPTAKYKYCELRFPSIGGTVMGFPQGPHAWRQFTFYGVHMDEVAFWPDFLETLRGARPATQRSIVVSSPEEGSGFKQWFKDEVEK